MISVQILLEIEVRVWGSGLSLILISVGLVFG